MSPLRHVHDVIPSGAPRFGKVQLSNVVPLERDAK
jgi:hypothetical protein